ncbi:MAG: sensor histidine kinase [Flammeovirgaceae bacterium]
MSLSYATLAQVNHMVLHNEIPKHSINEFAKVYEDQSGEATFKEIQQKTDAFCSYDSLSQNLNQSASYWLRVSVENEVKYRKEWILTTTETDIVELYQVTKTKTHGPLRTGKLVPYSARNVKGGKPHLCRFQLELPVGDTVTLWIRFSSPTKSLKGLGSSLLTKEQWKIHQYETFYTRQLIIGIFIGFLGIMFLYTFTNYLLVKDNIYLYYSIYILGPLLYTANYEGFLFPQLLGEIPLLYLYIRVLSPPFAIIGYLAFTRAFLKTSTLIPKWDRVFKGLIVIEILVIIYASIVIPFNLNIFFFRYIPVAFHVIVLFSTFLLSFTLLKDNKSLTRYFVLGVAAYTLSTIALNYVAISKALPLNIGLLIQAVGFVTELVSFSIGLGYRMKLNEDEKHKVEAENARILKEQNYLLEQQVLARTQEIQLQKEEIEVQAEELRATNEQLISLMDFKQAMTNMIVHDLKNPLASIMQLTKEANTKQTSLRMLNLVMNILDVDKMEETQIPIRWHRHRLSKVVNEAFEQVELLMEQKRIQFKTDLPKYALIYADYELIVRVLVNLLTNAIKFTPLNGEITIKATEEIEAKLKVCVINTGKGIPDSKINSLFDKYSQLEARKSGSVRASGLGLTFCKLVLEAHQCKISAESAENGPTTFWFTIPVKKDLSSTTTAADEPITIAAEKQGLTEKSKALIQGQLEKLAQLEVFDYSEIQDVLKEIDDTGHDELKDWKKEILSAISVCNQVRYQELIEL